MLILVSPRLRFSTAYARLADIIAHLLVNPAIVSLSRADLALTRHSGTFLLPNEWSILLRITNQELLRKVARDYSVCYEAIRWTIRVASEDLIGQLVRLISGKLYSNWQFVDSFRENPCLIGSPDNLRGYGRVYRKLLLDSLGEPVEVLQSFGGCWTRDALLKKPGKPVHWFSVSRCGSVKADPPAELIQARKCTQKKRWC